MHTAAVTSGLGTPGPGGPIGSGQEEGGPAACRTWTPGLEVPLGLGPPPCQCRRGKRPLWPERRCTWPLSQTRSAGEEVQSGRGPEACGAGQGDCGWGSRGYPPPGDRAPWKPHWRGACRHSGEREAGRRRPQGWASPPSLPSPTAAPGSCALEAGPPVGNGSRPAVSCPWSHTPAPRCPVPPRPPLSPLHHGGRPLSPHLRISMEFSILSLSGACLSASFPPRVSWATGPAWSQVDPM